jgi:nucleotide-binding universal stress UspA family protein
MKTSTKRLEDIMKNIKILVPLDFSELSKKALKAAEVFANIFEGSITPFHAYIPLTDLDGFHYLGSGVTTQDNLVNVEKIIQNRLKEEAVDLIDSRYLTDGHIGIGNPAHAIAEAAKDFDLIVMSTHGRTGFTRLLLGSVAEKVLRLSHTPVLIVEEGSVLSPLKNILLTTDFSENSYEAFEIAKMIAKASGAHIDLVHIAKVDDHESINKAKTTSSIRTRSLENLVTKKFADMKDSVTPVVISSKKAAHEAILDETQKKSYNLLIMATIGRTGLNYLMMGSTASHVVRHVETAVLSINPLRGEN